MTQPIRVVCLGGGYVALSLCQALRTPIKRGLVTLAIVDQNNFHTFHGLVPEMLGGKIQPGNIISPARRIFRSAQFHLATIEAIDLDQKHVVAAQLIDGTESRIPYDHLVFAIGSVDDLTRYPGIAEHAFKLKTYWDCFRVRHHLLSMLELGEVESDPQERQRLLTFVVAGGNYAGIETASEINELFRQLTKKEYKGISVDELRVAVVHSGEKILPELGTRFPRLQSYAQKHVTDCGVELILGRRLGSATALEAVLDDGTSIPTRTIISCTGSAQSPLLDSLPFEREKRGRIVTDEFVRVPGTDNIWAAGDCGAVPHPDGGYCPPLAIFAMRCGHQIGKNITRIVQGKQLKPYGFTGLGEGCSLAGRRGIGQIKGLASKGFIAWVFWRLLMLVYLPSWDRRVRVISDWLVWPLVGRDMVSVNPDDRLTLSTARYEAGQVVVRQGDLGKTLYLIREGEAEVIDQSGTDGELLGTLGPGQHFGETAVFQNSRRTATVRARTPLQLLEIHSEAARVLSDTLASVREEVSQQPQASPAAMESAGDEAS